MLSSTKKKKKTVFWLQGIIAITLSLFMYLFLCFLVYISWKSGSRPKFYVIFQRGHWESQSFAWQALEEGKVAVLPMQTWCTVRAFPSRTGASCRQGLRLRNLYSEVSMSEASAEALPRRFSQHLLIRGLGLTTFPHSDWDYLHAYLFPPFDPRSC